MGTRGNAVHVVRVRKSHVDKQGQRRDYESAYLRRTFRQDGKVRNETVANLSTLPAHVVDWVEAGLKGQSLQVPVSGTLKRPQLDQRAIANLSGQLIQNAAGQAVGNELNKALDKFLKPRQ